MEILNKIQKELKAPKNQFNAFGKYKYRSCEDILEAVKPLLGTATLTINDDIINIGSRYYVKATATLSDGKDSISTSAFARESENKKGMDESQITGATSSYARKYALNGLFLIDDTKDADTQDNSEKVVRETKFEKYPPNSKIEKKEATTVATIAEFELRSSENLSELKSNWENLSPELKLNKNLLSTKEELKKILK